MPIPKPNVGESRNKFFQRCMGDKTMTSEYPDNDQRMAVCASSFNSTKEQIRRDVFTTEEEAQARAEEIGCSGIHEHDEDGQTIFMPCSTHDEYIEATGRDVSSAKNDCGCDNVEDLKSYIECEIELKALEEGKEVGEFEGYASVFDNTDLGNDVIKSGAFTKSLRRKKAKGMIKNESLRNKVREEVFAALSEESQYNDTIFNLVKEKGMKINGVKKFLNKVNSILSRNISLQKFTFFYIRPINTVNIISSFA